MNFAVSTRPHDPTRSGDDEPILDPTDTVLETRLRVPSAAVDVASDRLWLAGAQAIEEVPGIAEPLGSMAIAELRTVLADTESECRRILGVLPADWQLDFQRRELETAHTWRDYARPIDVSERLVIVPAWGTHGPFDDSVTKIVVEPGSAFGLGDHPTTRLMLARLDEMIANGGGLAGRRVLDVGTGTGILAVVAASFGAAVTAIDIAPAAIEASRDNAQRNRVEIDTSTTPVEACEGTYDLVLANILAPTLIEISDDLKRLTAPGGELVISGILSGSFDHVLTALRPLEPISVQHLDGWAAVTLKNGASAD